MDLVNGYSIFNFLSNNIVNGYRANFLNDFEHREEEREREREEREEREEKEREKEKRRILEQLKEPRIEFSLW